MEQAFEIPAEGEDIFPQQIVEVDLGEPRWVRAIEFLPEDSRVTHHFLTTYVSELNEGDPAAKTPLASNWGGGFGDFFGFKKRLAEWRASGDLEGLDLEE